MSGLRGRHRGFINLMWMKKLLAIFISFNLQANTLALAQTQVLLTTTLYKTVLVSNPNRPVVSTVDNCDCNSSTKGLRFCDQITWSNFQSSASTTITSSTATPSPSTLPNSFVLGGSGDLDGFYLQFDATGNIFLSNLGEVTLLALHLDTDNALLQNARDASQLLFLRHNSSFIEEQLPTEDPAVLAQIFQVRIGDQVHGQLLSSDVYTGWLWDNQTDEFRFLYKGQNLSFYYTPTSLRRHRARDTSADKFSFRFWSRRGTILQRDIKFLTLILPLDIALSSDSSLEPLSLTPTQVATFSSTLFNTLPSSSPTSSLSSSSLSSSASSSSSTLASSTSSSSSSLFPSLPSTSSLSASSSASSSSPSTSPSSSPSRSSNSPSSSPSSPSPASSSSPSSSSLPNVYDVIVQYSLQDYCTTLLGYFTPVQTLPSAIYTTTRETSVLSTTTTSTTTTTTTTVTSSTSTTSFPVPAKRGVPPSQLSAYASTDIQSGCSQAISSPTDTSTTYSPTSTAFITSVSTTSTSISVILNTATSTTTIISSNPYPGIGDWSIQRIPYDIGTYYDAYYWTYSQTDVDTGATALNPGINPANAKSLTIFPAGLAPDGTPLWNMHTTGLTDDWVLCINITRDPVTNTNPASYAYADYRAKYFKVAEYAAHNVIPVVFKYDVATATAQLDNSYTYNSENQFFYWDNSHYGFYIGPSNFGELIIGVSPLRTESGLLLNP
ncbi:hypothetical protein AA313_de0204857 [Arthrobotrys entomopaga]|nr:hypothetical protein AA313_de0204857 [Arthrobotrys entomopaga]